MVTTVTSTLGQICNGGGLMILVMDCFRVIPLSTNDASCNAANVCAVKLLGSSLSILIAAVYRAPWTSALETCKLFDVLSRYCNAQANR